MNYARTTAYVMLFVLIIATTTLVLHELGHYTFASAVGCKNLKIVLLDDEGTYTQMSCPTAQGLLPLSGLLLVVPFSAALYFISEKERYLSAIAFGFNLIISSSDFNSISTTVYYASTLAGAFLVVLGQALLININLHKE